VKGEEAGKAALGKERALPLRGKALVKEVGKAKIGRRRLSTREGGGWQSQAREEKTHYEREGGWQSQAREVDGFSL